MGAGPARVRAQGWKSPALLAYIASLNILGADAPLVRARLDPAATARKGIERHHVSTR
jgi:hypothetical protein